MFDRRDWIFLALAALVLLAATLPWIATLGVEHDEAHFYPAAAKLAFGSPERLRPPDGLYVAHRPIPFMTMPYVGGFDAWLYAAAFGIGGANRVAPRILNIGLGLLFFVLAYRLGRTIDSRAAAIGVVALLLIDLEFLLHTPPNFGPFLVQLVCGTAAAQLLLAERRSTKHLLGAFALLGLALNEKLTFAWFGGSLMAALLLCYRDRLLAHRWRLLPAALVTILVAAPTIWYAYGRPEIVFGFGRSNARLPMGWTAIADKIGQWQLLLDGRFSLPWQLGVEPPFARWSWIFPLLCLSMIAALLPGASRALRLSALIAFGVFAANLPFPDAGRLHHLILMYPFPQLAIALAALWLWRSRLKWQTALTIVGCLLYAVMAFSTIRHLIWYNGEVARSGGRETWSSSTAELAAWANEHRDLHYVTASWGIDNVLTAFTRARIAPESFYFDLLADPPSPETARRIDLALRREDTVWLFSDLQPQYLAIRERIFARARQLGFEPAREHGFREITAYRFHPPVTGEWTATGESLRSPRGAYSRVSFTVEAQWDMQSALVVELLTDSGAVAARFRRPFEYFPAVHRRLDLEFGVHRYPDWFLPEVESVGEPVSVRVAADGLPNPITVSQVRFR